ncbi:MAG TPA: hypothetical protein VES88_16460 [Gemmatimonadaceae bacterium]|nr:hypothetical protein [Gemmatimonadaceae bacterium]
MLTVAVAPVGHAQPVHGMREMSGLRLYQGPVHVKQVAGIVDLADTAAMTRLTLVLRNDSAATQAISAGFRGAPPERISVQSRDTNRVVVPVRVERTGSRAGAQTAAFELFPELMSLPASLPPEEVNVLFLLPPGASFLRAKTPMVRDTTSGRIGYRLARKRAYLTRVNIAYTTGRVALEIQKSMVPTVVDRVGPVTVTLVVRNVGSATASSVVLHDDFDPGDFAGEGAEFTLVNGKENDRRLVWSHRLDTLEPNGTATVRYTVRALLPITSVTLSAVTATSGQDLVGVSNRVRLDRLRR